MKLKIMATVAVAALGIIAYVTYQNRGKIVNTEEISQVEISKYPVQTVVVTPETLMEELVTTGLLEAEQDVVVQAEVAGKVSDVFRQLGDRCKKGKILVRLDSEAYRIAMAQARAKVSMSEVQLDQARREWERMEKLKASAVVTAQQLDQSEGSQSTATAGLAQAQAAFQVAERNLRETNIRCPFSGFVAEQLVEVGQTVGPNVPIARIVDLSKLRLVVSVTSAVFARIKVGQSAVLSDPSRPNRVYRGLVSRLGVAADRDTRNFPLEIQVSDEKSELRAGQIVQAKLKIAEYVDAVAVPINAVLRTPNGTSVFTVSGEVSKKVEVKTGPQIGGKIIIVEGIKKGDEVISVGGEELHDGVLVEVIRPKAKETTPVASNPSSDL